MVNQNNSSKLKLRQIFASVLAAFFGVQSNNVRERDFSQHNYLIYITVGIFCTLAFIIIVFFLVKLAIYFL